jgi:hypothetical protein
MLFPDDKVNVPVPLRELGTLKLANEPVGVPVTLKSSMVVADVPLKEVPAPDMVSWPDPDVYVPSFVKSPANATV